MKSTKLMSLIGVMTALSFVLYLVEIPVGFLFPAAPFLKIDFSDVPAILMSIVYGPLVGIVIEFFKNVLHFLFKSETPAASGEIANFFAGIAFFLPYVLYKLFAKTQKITLKSMAIFFALGTLALAGVMVVINYTLTLPLYGIPAEQRWGFINAITPFNLLKGTLLSVVTILIYPRLQKFLSA